MARQHSGQQKYRESVQIAADYGLRIVRVPGKYLVYRVMKNLARDVFLGSRISVDGLHELIRKASGSK